MYIAGLAGNCRAWRRRQRTAEGRLLSGAQNPARAFARFRVPQHHTNHLDQPGGGASDFPPPRTLQAWATGRADCQRLQGDVKKIRTAVVAGTGIPLLMFLAWDAAILGSLGQANSSGADPLQTLIRSEPVVGPLVQVFSFLAVTTSFIGFLFGLADFVGDLLGVRLPPSRAGVPHKAAKHRPGQSQECWIKFKARRVQVPSGEKSPLPFAVCIVPPTILALSYPDVFFKALDYAGTYGVLLLFGLTPAAMAWSER